MKKIIDQLAPFIGPKLTGLLAGVTTAVGQIESRLATSPFGTTAMDLVEKAIEDQNLFALLPAPIAAIIGYVARDSESTKAVSKGVVVPPGKTVDSFSDVIKHYGDDRSNREYFTYAELIAGDHIPKAPADIYDELEERMDQAEHVIDGVSKEVFNEINLLRKSQELLRKQLSELLTAHSHSVDEHEARAEAVDEKVLVVTSSDDSDTLSKLKSISKDTLKKINNFFFSRRSTNNLNTVHQHLHEIFALALDISPYDFIVTRGKSTQAEQAKLMRKRPKVTWTKNSRHLYGLAVDIAVLDENGEVTWKMPYYVKVGEAIRKAADHLGYPVTIGALDWGKDGPHPELSKEMYPDDGSLSIDDPYKY